MKAKLYLICLFLFPFVSHAQLGYLDLDSIDLADFSEPDIDTEAIFLRDQAGLRGQVFSLTQKVKDSPSLESYEEWLKEVRRLVEEYESHELLDIFVEHIDESSSLLYKYKSKAKDMLLSPRQRQRYLRLAERYEVDISERVAEYKNLKLLFEQSSKRMNDFLDLIEQDIEELSDLMVQIRENKNFTQRSAIMKTKKIIQLDIESFLSDPENRERLSTERQKFKELFDHSVREERIATRLAEEFDALLLEGNKTKE